MVRSADARSFESTVEVRDFADVGRHYSDGRHQLLAGPHFAEAAAGITEVGEWTTSMTTSITIEIDDTCIVLQDHTWAAIHLARQN